MDSLIPSRALRHGGKLDGIVRREKENKSNSSNSTTLYMDIWVLKKCSKVRYGIIRVIIYNNLVSK